MLAQTLVKANYCCPGDPSTYVAEYLPNACVALRYGHQRRLQKGSSYAPKYLLFVPHAQSHLRHPIGAFLPNAQGETVVRVAQVRGTMQGLADVGRGSSVVIHDCFVGTALALGDPLRASGAPVSGRSHLFLRPSSAASIRRQTSERLQGAFVSIIVHAQQRRCAFTEANCITTPPVPCISAISLAPEACITDRPLSW
ncbi:hypothetical protein BU25DRAFT_409481 [Macroventuria anomochaeta]|uniref:Uncharacterized protein n=1 Tax=Macroventuria anomochaeta TaxID=301207 RepID=A0ACB6S494_9PLEO|nr:uncharacterized protein BU25DRAFT_409481 [Macroventuria anomochaeta]KAF2628996.1 hypothetical protein BU25DRAFT_409481 [Macroventuria anomochaeta]